MFRYYLNSFNRNANTDLNLLYIIWQTGRSYFYCFYFPKRIYGTQYLHITDWQVGVIEQSKLLWIKCTIFWNSSKLIVISSSILKRITKWPHRNINGVFGAHRNVLHNIRHVFPFLMFIQLIHHTIITGRFRKA